MKKKMVANIVMVAMIVVIAVAGILTVGHIQGWFDTDDGSFAVLTQLRGIITMERDGVAYTAESETVLRQGDRITCGSGATAVIQIGDDYLSLGENAKLVIEDAAAESFSAMVTGGEVFVNTSASLKLSFDGRTVAFGSTVAALSIRSGAQSISVFEGNVEGIPAGQTVEWIGETVSVSELKLSTLNDFTMGQIRSANESKTLCFSNSDLDGLIAQREEELQAMLSATEGTEPKETAVPTEPATVPTTEPVTEPTTEPTTAPATAPTTEPTTVPATAPTTEPTTAPTTAPTTEPTTAPATEPATEPTTEPTTVPAEPKNTCTITIRCDTILRNMDSLDPAKTGYVPSSGVILSTKTVEFEDGETVFDVLKRVCSAYGIQLEYSWTPMYDSYYIEGINYLYEFDCGSESGWMYRVNGWFPNYGCSGYTLKDGDSIVWCYTCTGLGEDVGA